VKFNWTIDKLIVAENNLVVKVDLTVTGTNDNLLAAASYTRALTRGNSFIPYEQLTEQQVLDWCFAPEIVTWVDKDNVSQSIIKHLKDVGEAQVTDQIARQLVQKQLEPALPWVKTLA
jgi:hypothetical protein